MNTDHMDQNQKIAIFGSAFNPPTLAHLYIIQCLSNYDAVLLVPSYDHAWEKKMAHFSIRCKWVLSLIKDSGCHNVQLNTDEKKIYQGQPITTWRLLNHLQNEWSGAELTFVMGPDNFINFNKFYRSRDILKKWKLLTCPEILPIRSTLIRKRLLNGEDISDLTTPQLAISLKKEYFDC